MKTEARPAFTKILVPLDGSELADRALSYAQKLARSFGGRLFLVRATDLMASHEGQLLLIQDAEAALARVSEQLTLDGIPTEPHVYPGLAVPAVLDAAATHSVDLIVMSTHGRGGLGRWVFGSTAEQVLRVARQPLLLIPPHCQRQWDGLPGAVMVPLDGSALAEAALDPASRLAFALKTALSLVSVIEPPSPTLQGGVLVYPPSGLVQEWAEESKSYLNRIAERLRKAGQTVKVEVDFGYPAASIARLANERPVDAVVMATHGRTGLPRVLMGTVTSGVLQRVNVPVLAVRPAFREEEAPSVAPPEKIRAGIALNAEECDLITEGLQLLLARRQDQSMVDPINHLLNRLNRARSTEESGDQAEYRQTYSA